MAIATLSIDFIAKLAELEQGFAKAASLADKSAKSIEGSFAGLQTRLVELGKVIGELFAVKKIAEFVLDINKGVAALEDLSVATGSTVENLSALEDVGLRTGNSFETMATTLVKFNKALNDAKAGDEVTRVFTALGLSVKDLKAQDPAEALRLTAVALEQFANEGDKARAVQVLFGRTLREAAPFIKDLASQTQLHATVTAEAAKKAKEFDNALNELSKNSTDTGRAIVGPIIEGLNALIEKFKEARKASLEWAQKGKEEDAAIAAEKRAAAIKITNDMLEQNTKLLDSNTLSLERRARLENQRRGLLAQQREQQTGSVFNENFDSPGETRDRPKPSLKVKDAAITAQTEIQKLTERYRELFEVEMNVGRTDTELAKARALLADPKYATATLVEKQAVLDYADGLHKLRLERERNDEAVKAALENDRLNAEQLAAIKKEADDLAKAYKALEDSTPTNRFVEQQKVVDDLTRRFNEGLIPTYERYMELVRQATGQESINTFRTTLTDMQDLALEAATNINHTLGETISDTLSGNFADIGKAWKNMLVKMAADALLADISKNLFGDLFKSGSSSGLGGWFGTILGMTGVGSRASGGLVAPWSLTQVNDQAGASGVEGFSSGGRDFMLTGSQGGRVTQAGGRAAAVVQVNIAAGVSRNEVAALIPALKQQIKAEVVASMRRPGFSGG